jgi:SecY interacting protein Syd
MIDAAVDVAESLDRFIARCVHAIGPRPEPFDQDWRSPCERGAPFAGPDGAPLVDWQPVRRDVAHDNPLDAVERALELALHPDAKSYYGRWWSACIRARAPDGPVSLIFLWNADDAERLAENLIGHALAKRRQRAPFTVFFANTDSDSEYFLSIDNATGAIWLEEPGRPPIRQVAPSLSAFLDSLEAAPV